MRIIGCLFLICIPLLVQPSTGRRFRFGVTGGIPLMSSNVSTASNPSSYSRTGVGWDRYAAGISFEAYLNDHISLEFNPLYHRTGAERDVSDPVTGEFPGSMTTYKSYVIDLPVIGKYTFRDADASWRPFVGSGFAFNTARQTADALVFQPGGHHVIYDQWAPWDVGAVFDVGIRYRVRWVEIAPEVRYTRWGGRNLSHGLNQPEFLVSFRF